LDQAMMSAGIASIWEVGLETGKMTGRPAPALIVWTTCRVNAPCAVDAPISTVGFTWPTTVSSVTMPEAARAWRSAAICGHRVAADGSTCTGVVAQPATSAAGRA
jgi:hypothetical protein